MVRPGGAPADVLLGGHPGAAPEEDGGGDGWNATLHLALARRRTRTVIVGCAHHGPLAVQRPFYPEGAEPCHVYLLHPPGGVVAGDRLYIDLQVDAGAHALVTTPAATKFYRSRGRRASQWQTLRVASGATLEWLPQEAIVFDGARVRAGTRILASSGARILAWELACFGRPAAGERFRRGLWDQSLELYLDDETPALLERHRIAGTDVHARAALRGAGVIGTLLAWPGDQGLVDIAHHAGEAAQGKEVLWAVTDCDGVLVGRALGRTAETVRATLQAVWAELRPCMLGRAPCVPRIWST